MDHQGVGQLVPAWAPPRSRRRRSATRRWPVAAGSPAPTPGARATTGLGDHPAEVAHARAAVRLGVGVEDLAPVAGDRQADAVVAAATGERLAIEASNRRRRSRAAATRRRCPRRRWRRSTRSPRGSLSRSHSARVSRYTAFRSRTQCWTPECSGNSQQPPVEAALLAPLATLGELRAHEQQLLAGVRPHVAAGRRAGWRTSARGRRASGRAASPCRARPRRARSAARSSR